MKGRKPHTCPECKGKLKAKQNCEVCEGTGVVWEPEVVEAVATQPVGDLDLTYRRG